MFFLNCKVVSWLAKADMPVFSFLHLSDTEAWGEFGGFPLKQACRLFPCLAREWNLPSLGKILKSSCEIEQNFHQQKLCLRNMCFPFGKRTQGREEAGVEGWSCHYSFLGSCDKNGENPSCNAQSKIFMRVSDGTLRLKPGVHSLILTHNICTHNRLKRQAKMSRAGETERK